jgi:hypothetical protein
MSIPQVQKRQQRQRCLPRAQRRLKEMHLLPQQEEAV